MAANTNIVEFGLEGVRYSLTTFDAGGTPSFTSPVAEPGAVDLTFEVSSNEMKFYADNIAYYTLNSLSGRTGSLEMAKFSDAFKTAVLGYKETADGGLAEVDSAKAKALTLSFIGDGDAHRVKHVIYNIQPGHIERSHHTNEEGVEVETEVLPFTVIGIKVGDDRVAHVTYPTTAAGYDGIDSAVPTPAFGTPITFSVEQVGGESGVTKTASIDFTFGDSVVGLTASHINVASGTGSATKGVLSGAGTSWSLAISNPTEGNVTVSIASFGAYAFPDFKVVTIYAAP